MKQLLHSRKGFEMAAGTLVVMILGVIIVTAGLVLVWRIVSEGQQLNAHLTSDTKDQLAKQLNDGKLVAAAPASQEVLAGQTGTYGVAIVNRLGADKNFKISVDATDPAGHVANLAGPNTKPPSGFWGITYFTENLKVKAGETGEEVITVTPPKNAPSGTYTFFVTVTYPDAQNIQKVYDSVRFFTVRVP